MNTNEDNEHLFPARILDLKCDLLHFAEATLDFLFWKQRLHSIFLSGNAFVSQIFRNLKNGLTAYSNLGQPIDQDAYN